ncbi:MAG: ABC transporter ATP-binding protein [Aureliella sp.]
MFAVETQQLAKTYGDFRCLIDCSMQVGEGIVFGLLGPNGAGKSTLIRTLMGFLNISAGKATVCGFDVATDTLNVRRNCAYLPGDPRLYRAMRGRAVLELFSGLHHHANLSRSIQVAERLGLDLSRRVMFMSTGMRQNLATSIVASSKAPLVILDEPTANLDPNVRATVLELIREIRADGRTVILSSHIFSDIDDTCDEVAILRSGRIVTQQSMSEVSNTHLVHGRLPSNQVDVFESNCSDMSFVQNLTVAEEGTESAIQMTLASTPDHWLKWLHDSPVTDMSIQRSGVAALYRQFHSETVGQDAGVAT